MPETDPLAVLESRIPEIRDAKLRQQLGDALDDAHTAVEKISESADQLEKVSPYASEIREHLAPADLTALQQQLTEARNHGKRIAEASDTEALAKVRQDLQSATVQSIKQAKDLIQRGWAAKLDQEFSSLGSLGAVLQRIPEAETLGTEMEGLFSQAARLGRQTSEAASGLGDYRTLKADQAKAQQRLAELGIEDQVTQFLLAVSNRSATLAQVTEKTRIWLQEHHALGLFKVTL